MTDRDGTWGAQDAEPRDADRAVLRDAVGVLARDQALAMRGLGAVRRGRGRLLAVPRTATASRPLPMSRDGRRLGTDMMDLLSRFLFRRPS